MKRIRITENKLHQLIREAVDGALMEGSTIDICPDCGKRLSLTDEPPYYGCDWKHCDNCGVYFCGTEEDGLECIPDEEWWETEKENRQFDDMFEAHYRNVGEDIESFTGRRPKTIKARINQIYKMTHKYGLSSRKYYDDHWQALRDYDTVISSLGCDFTYWCENGGYTDYSKFTGMNMSKVYNIEISYDDGMVISGYIKMMAAGSMEDPFDAYDTCMVLWPKSSVRESVDDKVRSLVYEAILDEGWGNKIKQGWRNFKDKFNRDFDAENDVTNSLNWQNSGNYSYNPQDRQYYYTDQNGNKTATGVSYQQGRVGRNWNPFTRPTMTPNQKVTWQDMNNASNQLRNWESNRQQQEVERQQQQQRMKQQQMQRRTQQRQYYR